jgi:murein DD-endopeptidase MepM/ murein hydrolase activator NlpD
MFIPVEKPCKITSGWGPRTIFGKQQFHKGIDFVSKTGLLDVFAAYDGEIFADMDNYNHLERWKKPNTGGNWIMLKHEIEGRIYYTQYLHLGYNRFNFGDRVVKAQMIGEYGDYGRSTGPHLHFSLLTEKFNKINPTSWFKLND